MSTSLLLLGSGEATAADAAHLPAGHGASPSSARLLLGPLALAAVRRAVLEATAQQPVPETGGKMLGCWCEDGSVLAVLPLEAGPETRASPTRFQPDTAWQQAQYERAVGRHPRLRLVLDWHLHPDGPATLSARDLKTFSRLLGPDGWGLTQVVAMVALPPPLAMQEPIPAQEDSRSWAHEAFPGLNTGTPEVHCPASSSPEGQETSPRLLAWGLRSALASAPSAHPRGRPPEAPDRALCLQPMRVEPLSDDDPRLDWLMMTDAELTQHLGTPLPAGEAPLVRACLPGPPRIDAPSPGMRSLAARAYARNAGLLDAERLAGSAVTFVGLGSVGAPLALLLGQAGVGRFCLLDEDRLSIENLSRHPGDQTDLHRRKSDIVRSRLQARDPAIRALCPRLDVLELAHRCALEAMVGESQLLVVSTDEPRANLAAARLALQLGIPALFIGIFAEGAGGEIFVQYPQALRGNPNGRAEADQAERAATERPVLDTRAARAKTDEARVSGCYSCLAGFRARLPPLPKSARAHDYSALRPGATLPPMHALAIDIHHTVSMAARVALELLALGGASSEAPGGALRLLTPQLPLLLVSNGAPVWIFERPFEVIPARLDQQGCGLCAGANPRADLRA